MSIEETMMEILQTLSPEQKQELLDFAEFLVQKSQHVQPRRNILGMYEHLGVHISKEEIDEARREMWKGFPREFPKGANDEH